MKTLKLFMTIGLLLFCTGMLISQDSKAKPQKETLADITIEKLNKDVQLTDSQKIALKDKFNVLVIKSESANKKLNEKEKFELKKKALDEYQAILESILTTTQKDSLNIRIQQRINSK